MSEWKTEHTELGFNCPRCNEPNRGFSARNHLKVGDIGICDHCTNIFQITELGPPMKVELRDAMDFPEQFEEIRRMQRRIIYARAVMNGINN